MLPRRLLLCAIAIVLAMAVYLGIDAPETERRGLGILVLVACLWLSEALPLSTTAMLVPLLAVMTGILDTRGALQNFAHPIIFLFMGGFALAAALRKYALDRWLANGIVRVCGGQLRYSLLALFAVTALLSMWISNTATTAMMLPVVLGLLAVEDDDANQAEVELKENEPDKQGLVIFALLGLAYSASIGGMATLVGSPPNAIAAAALELDFIGWLERALPLVMFLWPAMLVLLWWLLKPAWSQASLQQLPAVRVAWSQGATTLLVLFAVIVSLWIFSRPIAELLDINKGFDALVALLAMIALVALGLLNWQELEQGVDWGILLLFGGGITLSAVLSGSGASVFLAEGLMAALPDSPARWVYLLAAIGLMIFLTELASNTASAALLVPVFLALPGSQLGFPPELMALAVGLAASCAFMLPVATPPNALVYGSGRLPLARMATTGLWVNILALSSLTLYFSF